VKSRPEAFLPVKDLVFRILLVLADGERHAADLSRALDESSAGAGVLPGHFYRTVDRMLDEGLIDESDNPSAPRLPRATRGVPPTRFVQLTALGRAVARAETDRLEALVLRSRSARLLRGRR